MRAAAFALAALCAGCTDQPASEQARACRITIPALNAGAKAFKIEGTSPGHRPNSLRISYRVTKADGAEQSRHVICLFAGAMQTDGRKDEKNKVLVALATEDGPLSEAAFYFLKRFYLEDKRDPPQDVAP